ncbi:MULTISPECIES: hypothetical protein [Rhodopseudomonas]|uniref:Uncharacterized protein n=1 Tax=Rhodopseudomonas palustris TaxID=1076 RepID=A0A0D7F444_RHOPL|nr:MULTISPECIES: hypothetical protein [Rhodopseudomonas]KIZ47839.1 hypothetical protein OO17_02160 [Rhodopseudomonas palustris]MDF3811042.1 hypothetical protein [Rhodopseudomonas sp. BAL398]WOK15938.1 hypothetical protein RBJ75_17395 [Rhodopseudomonas sp. BAL398]
MTDRAEIANELHAMAAAFEEDESIEPWRHLIESLFPPRSHLDNYAAVKRDRLLLKAAGLSVKDSIDHLQAKYKYSKSTLMKIVQGSAGAEVNNRAEAMFDAMTADERAGRLLCLSGATPTIVGTTH